MSQTVLITGANGFLGRVLTVLLRTRGFEVVTTDKTSGADLVGDLSHESFVQTLPDVDVLVNCAAVQYVSKDLPLLLRENYFLKNNIVTAENLFNKYKASKTHFIHIGTSMLYKQTGQALYRVSDTKTGEGVYSKSKALAQEILNNLPNLATVIPCIIAGKGREGLFVPMVKSIKRFKCAIFPGRGEHKVHMVHVEDVATLVLSIIEKKATGYFNAAGPDPISISEWTNNVGEVMGYSAVFRIRIPLLPLAWISKLLGYRVLAKEQLLMLKHPHVLDISESLALGWEPRFNNRLIVKHTAEHILHKSSSDAVDVT